MKEKCFTRAGIQPDGSLVQLISRQTIINGVRDWHPPEIGITTTTKQGSFIIKRITDIYEIEKGGKVMRYYRAQGELK